MTHIRQQIRDAVVARLTGLATTGGNVFGSRVYPIQPNEMPGVLVYSLRETADAETMGHPRLLVRRADIAVEVLATANADLDDTLDTAAKEIEVAIAADMTLGGVCRDIMMTATDITLKGDGDKIAGSARLTFEVIYTTAENDPETLR